jgi:hypothetical protein
MKRYRGLVLLIGLALIVAACSPSLSPEERARQVTCSQVIVIPVFDLDGTLVTKFVSGELKSHYEYDAFKGMSNRYPDHIEEWNAFYDQVNAGISKANAQLAHLYAESSSLNGVSFGKQGPVEGQYLDGKSDIDWQPCPTSDDPNQTTWDSNVGFRFNFDWDGCDAEARTKYFCTDTSILGDTTYVAVTTPGGSRIDYSYPTAWLNQILWSSFGTQEALVFNPEFVSPDVVLDQQTYGENLLRTLVGDGSGREISSFTLVVSDFQGRNMLRPVIAKAMEIAAVQTGHPVVMTLKGLMSNGQYTVANISAHLNWFNINGWLVSEGGGDMKLKENYSSYFEDLTRGSIYVLNP